MQFELTIMDPDNPKKYYSLSMFEEGVFWLRSSDGEGMTIKESNLYDLLHAHYVENF